MARVLVTGGAGFIGSHLAHALVQRGDQVRILDNFSTGNAANLAGIEANIELLDGDIRRRADVIEAVTDVEIVFHEAALVSVPESIADPKTCFDINVDGTIQLMEAARSAGVQRVVMASSAAVYGSLNDLPLKESGPTQCLSPYAASKLFNEVLAGLYSLTYGLPSVALRYFNVYGPRQSPNSAYAAAIPKFITQLTKQQSPVVYGDGKQTRDFVYVGDVVRANLLAAEAKGVEGQVFNVCSGSEIGLLDLLDVLYSILPKAPDPRFEPTRLGDVPRSVGDPEKAAQAMGFRPQTMLQDGLRACLDERRP